MLDKKYTGGSMFATGNTFTDQGITVRDFFAAAALQGMLANCAGEYSDEEHVKAAYDLADTMMKERNAI